MATGGTAGRREARERRAQQREGLWTEVAHTQAGRSAALTRSQHTVPRFVAGLKRRTLPSDPKHLAGSAVWAGPQRHEVRPPYGIPFAIRAFPVSRQRAPQPAHARHRRRTRPVCRSMTNMRRP
jgi:hypothetical protein